MLRYTSVHERLSILSVIVELLQWLTDASGMLFKSHFRQTKRRNLCLHLAIL